LDQIGAWNDARVVPRTECDLFALLDDEQRIGAKPPNSFAMWLGASV
jgi:hypothetical protein